MVKCQEKWQTEVSTMSKLDTYVLVKDFTEIGVMIQSGLPRGQHSVMSKFLCGILPLEIETGHYRRLDRHLRVCKLCESNTVEDEMNFLFSCSALESARKEWIEPLVKQLDNYKSLSVFEKTKCLLERECIKDFGKALEHLFAYCKDTLYRPTVSATPVVSNT